MSGSRSVHEVDEQQSQIAQLDIKQSKMSDAVGIEKISFSECYASGKLSSHIENESLLIFKD